MTKPLAEDVRTTRRSAAEIELARLAAIADELGDCATVTEADDERQRLIDSRYFVACLGQFKRGKSSLINALVGKPLLPIGVIPVTTVVTVLKHGDQNAASVYFTDGHHERIALDAVAEFVDERRNPGNARRVALVEIDSPSTILRDGLCLVDTPGLGSVHAANTAATRAFVPRIDVALLVVGPDPPISGAELALAREVIREADDLIVVMNKCDQVPPNQLPDVVEFTRSTIASALKRPVALFEVSALERLQTRAATRDWAAFHAQLEAMSHLQRERLVAKAGDRAVRRLVRRLDSELSARDEALRRPLADTEARAMRLRTAMDDVDRSLVELRFRFDAVEADLGSRFEEYRKRFLGTAMNELQRTLAEWIEHHRVSGRSLRAAAFEEAHRITEDAIQHWLDGIDAAAHGLYRKATERLVQIVNDYLARIAIDAADVATDELPPELGFRVRRHFHFTSLMHLTAGGPIAWLVDRIAPSRIRTAHITRAATAYLIHLLESNAYRVESDFRDRAHESRRWLEGRMRARLATAVESAERALAVAIGTQRSSRVEWRNAVERIDALRLELKSLRR